MVYAVALAIGSAGFAVAGGLAFRCLQQLRLLTESMERFSSQSRPFVIAVDAAMQEAKDKVATVR